MTIPELRYYQREMGEAVERDFLDNGQNRLLIKAATGTGKTVFFAALLERFPRLRDWLNTFGPKGWVLIVAHREELLDQAHDKVLRANPKKHITIEQGSRYANIFSDVIIASIQTLSAQKFKRLHRLIQRRGVPRLVIVDEGHHSAADTYRTSLAHMGFLPSSVCSDTNEIEAATHSDVEEMKAALEAWDQTAPKDRLLLGVTATPNRTDAIGLGCVFQTISYTYDMKRAIDDGYLAPPKPWVIETAESLDKVRTSHGDFNQKDLATAVNTEERNRLGVAAYLDHAAGLQGITFTVDVAHAHDFAAAYRAAGVDALAISGETPKEDRRQALESYRNGRVMMLTNCMVLTEGTDLPMCACIVHGKPTKSGTLYEQMTGRGARPHPDDPVGQERLAALARGAKLIKPEFIVIDLVDIARKHSLQTAAILYGLPPGLVTQGEDLQKILDALEEMRERYPGFDVDATLETGRYTLADLLARASTFDVWTIPDMGVLRDVVSMNWIPSGRDFRLHYPWADGQEILEVKQDMLGHYDISLTLVPKEGQKRQRTIAAQVQGVEAALKLAETFVRQERRSASRVTDTQATWRFRPASKAQIAYLDVLRVPHRQGISAGEASDLISFAKSRRA